MQNSLPVRVIGVSETWLNDLTSDQVSISGYNFVSNHRNSKTGGGTVVSYMILMILLIIFQQNVFYLPMTLYCLTR